MLKSLPCLGRQCQRAYATVAPSDRLLRAAFDDIHQNAITSTSKALFGYDNLRRPSDLPVLARKTAHRASAIVKRIYALPQQFAANGTTAEQAILVMAKQFDRLSDLLCSVCDPCEFIRNVHHQEEWILAANETFEYLWSYMNHLNTDAQLYHTLQSVTEPFKGKPIPADLFAAYEVSLQFLRDFEKSGIHLSEAKRRRFVELSDQASSLGTRFMTQNPQPSNISLTYNEAIALGPSFVQKLKKRGDKYETEPNTQEAYMVSRHHPSERVRKMAWSALGTFGRSNVDVLEDLLRNRAETARLLGKASWAEVVLSDKMAKTPENVMAFLENLSNQNAKDVEREWKKLEQIRQRHRPNDTDGMSVWDRDFYAEYNPDTLMPALSVEPYFSLGTVIQGISTLFKTTFGVSFTPVSPEPNESLWHPTVRKLLVSDEAHGKLGYIYCDLFQRQHKPHGPSHYTIRCARRVDDDNADADLEHDPTVPGYEELVVPGSESRRGLEGRWQLPISVLSCDFSVRSSARVHLKWTEVTTLVHELGHALHSMLGQTPYQNVSGTRCATDFVELPSILMEHFGSSPAVLKMYAHHHETGAPLPDDTIQRIQALAQTDRGVEQARQISLAALDQAYHSSAPLQAGWNSTTTYHDVFEHFAPHGSAKGLRASGSNWQVHFTHLVGYGAVYYAYLFDRAIANQVWKQVFEASGGLDREAGEKYRREVLAWGGGKDPWECLAALLENDKLAKGGSEAMAEVGRWGIQEH